jgi:DNA-binding response OmpR family regulator
LSLEPLNGRPLETVLIIDDSVDLVSLLTDILSLEGYRVTYAHNGRDGLELALATEPDLIMLDMHMPLMNGLETLERLRAADKKIPVIFMTRFGTAEMAVRAFRLGVYHYLDKPFDIEEVQKTVADALRETRLKREQAILQRNLIAAETVRQTVVTLSHHINNQLMVIQTSIAILQEIVEQELNLQRRNDLLRMVAESQKGAARITAVLNVLQTITSVESTDYHETTKMLDIAQALELELLRLGALPATV